MPIKRYESVLKADVQVVWNFHSSAEALNVLTPSSRKMRWLSNDLSVRALTQPVVAKPPSLTSLVASNPWGTFTIVMARIANQTESKWNDFVVKPLDQSIWPAYADLIERHNGIWGGCWCMGFQTDGKPEYTSLAEKKADKHALVCKGRTHAAVVFDGDLAVGWCQYGRSDEIAPRNKFKKTYFPGLEAEPDWRITCFFVDRKYRGKKVSSLALDGALKLIAEAGGGFVEAYPEEMADRTTNLAFICLGTTAMFERRGFHRQRQVAKHHWVMTKLVDKATVDHRLKEGTDAQ